MQQGRGRGGKYPEETCGQERRVEGDDKAVIRLNAVHELRTQCAEFGEVAQVFAAEGHVGGFAGNVAGIAHGDRHVRGGQCGSIVDSVAHHNHAAAFGLHFFHIAVLVFGQHLRKEGVDAQKLCRANLEPLRNLENAALEILERLNLKEYANCHPMVLSGGQKQRVAIGSGVSSGRDIVVFDEPTSGLDYRQMLSVSATLQKLAAGGKTLLVITHDPEFILNCCDNVIRMDHGNIAEQYPLQGNQEKLVETMLNV